MLKKNNPSLRILLEIKYHIVEAVNYNVSDYGKFYPKHLKNHYVQLEDCPSITERSYLRIPAVFIFDIEFRYQTVIEFQTIEEQEYIERQERFISKTVFSLRSMNISYTMYKQYLEYLKIQSMIAVDLEIDEILKINFDSAVRVQ